MRGGGLPEGDIESATGIPRWALFPAVFVASAPLYIGHFARHLPVFMGVKA